MKAFFSDFGQPPISYTDLINDINNRNSYPEVINHKTYYDIFRDLIISLLSGKSIVVLDSDLSDLEIESLGFSKNDLNKRIDIDSLNLLDENDLFERLTKNNSWELTLFTSGTTGKPKRITHSFKTITKAVKISNENSNDVWGFAYNPTHIAGIQVFFQALLNFNHIVRLFMLSKESIFDAIEQNMITNISATPTFYRLLLDVKKSFQTVKRITSGGEKFDESLRYPLLRMFPNAKILNVYASTEIGTLFASEGDIFIVKENLKHLVKIENDELYISGEMTGKSNDIEIVNGWFKTGDRVEVISSDPIRIRFIGRVNESINVGGYKVYPTEVEECINSIPGVRRSLVYSKKNSVLGNVILCDIELEDSTVTEKIVYEYLKERLQSYKIPRVINFVQQIGLTRTGKIARK